MRKKIFTVIVLIILPILAGLACRFTAADPTATPRVEIQPEVEQEAEVEEEPTTPPIELPTEVVETEAPVEPAGEESFQDLVRLDKNVWIQEENTVFVAFFFQNPNSNILFEDVEYTVTLFGPNDEEIIAVTHPMFTRSPRTNLWHCFYLLSGR